LPHGRPGGVLYQLSVDEAKMQGKMERLHNLLTEPGVEGVYESKVPLDFKLLLKTGCVAKLNLGQLTDRSGDLSLSSFEAKSSAECPYLENVPMSTVFLYQSMSSDSRAVFALVFDDQVFVVVCFNGGTSVGEFRQALTNAKPNEVARDPSTFEVQKVKDLMAGFAAVDKRLLRFKNERRKASVVICQTSCELRMLQDNIPVLRSDFPTVSLPALAEDSRYPALTWMQFAFKHMWARLQQHDEVFRERLAVCRYAHIPIGNLPTDVKSFVSDVMFARALLENNHVLWVSKQPRPDLGGAEEDENYFDDEFAAVEVSMPGCYRSVCMELEMAHLAVNSVLTSESLKDESEEAVPHKASGGPPAVAPLPSSSAPETKGGDGTMGAAPVVVGGSGVDLPAFRVLYNLIHQWTQDFLAFSDDAKSKWRGDFSESLIGNFYRWVRSPASLLHDSLIHRTVHLLMKKIFMRLVARLKKLGGTVVFGNFNRVILCTNKCSVQLGEAYSQTVLRTICKPGSLFQYLSFSMRKVWETLLYMDSVNYAGLLQQGNSENPETDYKMDYSWNLAEYLPAAMQERFQVAVTLFFFGPFQTLRKIWENDTLSTDQKQQACAQTLRELVETQLTRTLMKMVSESKQQVFREDSGPGAALTDQPVLRFIKFVSTVLQLDTAVEEEVNVLRQNLLRMMQIAAFSPEAQFKNPSPTFVLPEVLCPHCNVTRDLDLCRDPSLLDEVWLCPTPGCGQAYDKDEIESTLVDIVQHRVATYQVRDLICVNCKKVKVGFLCLVVLVDANLEQDSNMAEYCSCAGSFRVYEPADKFVEGYV